MIGDYFTDTVTIFNKSFDNEWNQDIQTENEIDARVDATNNIIKDINGIERTATYIIYIDSGTTINQGDGVRIEKINGESTGDIKIYPILSIHKAHGFEMSHIELTV
jgi:hypothetical protein